MLSARRSPPCALAVLALFLASSTLPRVTMYAHHHPGGDHAHVHLWGEDALDHDHVDEHAHAHTATDDAGPVLEDADGGPALHVHWQAPFQHSTRSEAPRLRCTTSVRRLTALLHQAADKEPSPPAYARGPPSRSV